MRGEVRFNIPSPYLYYEKVIALKDSRSDCQRFFVFRPKKLTDNIDNICIMTVLITRQFHLVGDTPIVPRDIPIDPNEDLKTLKANLGLEFHIIEPSGNTYLFLVACSSINFMSGS